MTVPASDAAPSVSRLWSVARTHLTSYFGALEGTEILVREATVLAITGGPTPDYNICLVDDSPHVTEVVRCAAERARTRNSPMTFMISTRAHQTLGAELEAVGLTRAGEAPLMTFSGTPPAADADYNLVEATDASEMDQVAQMVADAFEMDLSWVRQTFASRSLVEGSAPVTFYIAERDGRPMSTVTVSGSGPVAGIWSMATPHGIQRRGAGRAALIGAMGRRRSVGARSFFLIATPAGMPLYQSVGFTTADTFPVYVSGT